MIITQIPPSRQRPQMLTLQPGLPPVDPHLLSLILQGAIEVHGSLGDITFRRTPHGVTVMRKVNPSRVKPSRAQTANRRAFRWATHQAQRIMQDPVAKSAYTRRATAAGLSLRQFLIRHFRRLASVKQAATPSPK